MQDLEIRSWAREEFGWSSLGDERRTARLVAMASGIAARPAGRVSEVFRSGADRQGAYDFLESPHVKADAVVAGVTGAGARRAAEYPFVFVPLDGTSINVTDLANAKGFGSVGSRERGALGLKAITALAVSPAGVPLGVAALEWWARGPRPTRSRLARTVDEKETKHWFAAVDTVTRSFAASAEKTRAWFQVDREGDSQRFLEKLADTGHLFTVRSQSDRRLYVPGAVLRPTPYTLENRRRRYLRSYLSRREPVTFELLEVPARGGAPSRLTCVSIRAASVTLWLRDKQRSDNRTLAVNAVWVREHGGGPMHRSRSGQSKSRQLDWLLLTNHPVDTVEEVNQVVFGYTQRWRIEDFHRAWKRGGCNVEDTQLRARDHVIKWATILAAVAVRAERLKHLAREKPTAPATELLSELEIRALKLLKSQQKKKNEIIPDGVPDLETATRWIADLGGYTGKSSGGPPGTVTISRGLQDLRVAVQLLAALAPTGKKR
jgi:hypothetical protein